MRHPAPRLVTLALVCTTVLALAGCGSQEESDAAGDDYRVTVTTPDDGTVTLDTEPRRLAVLNGNRVLPFLDPFLDEDIEVVGYGNDPVPSEFPWIQEELETLPSSPDVDGPDLETYASWRPDLLLANGNIGDYYEPVRQVGPLVHLPETDWRATVRLLGTIFEEPDVADRVIEETEATIEAARRPEPTTAVVLSPYQDNGTVGTQVPGAELPNFMAELGIEVAESPTAQDGYEDVSLERLEALIDGVDHVVLLDNGGDSLEQFLAEPVVRNLPAFQEDRVTTFSRSESVASFPVTPMTVPVVLDALAPLLD